MAVEVEDNRAAIMLRKVPVLAAKSEMYLGQAYCPIRGENSHRASRKNPADTKGVYAAAELCEERCVYLCSLF